MIRQKMATAVALAADAGALVGLRHAAATTASRLGHVGAWFSAAGPDRVLAQAGAAGLWLAGAWVALGIVAANGARLPGAAGRASAAVCRAVLPRAVRRLVIGSAGLSVVLAPIAAGATTAHATGSPAAVAVALSHSPHPSPAWPTLPAHHAHADRDRTRQPAEPADDRATVHVAHGDCLWLLAAHRLAATGHPATDRRIAAYWPRWYAQNRAVIGSDPDQLRPGEQLRVPPIPSVHHSGAAS